MAPAGAAPFRYSITSSDARAKVEIERSISLAFRRSTGLNSTPSCGAKDRRAGHAGRDLLEHLHSHFALMPYSNW